MSSDLVEIKQEDVSDRKSATASQLIMPSDDFLFMFGAPPSTSGIEVTPISAMRVPAVRGAVLQISEALGQVDANVYAVSDGSSQLATDHPAYELLNGYVNPWTSGPDFRGQLTYDALLCGNGYAAITRDSDGAPVELNRLQPERVFVYVHPDTMEPVYRYSPLEGAELQYAFDEVLHLRASSLNGVLGESPIIQARDAIALAIVMEAHAARLFKNGARPASSLNLTGTLNADAVARIRANLAAQHAGTASGSTIVLEQGAEFKQLSFTSVDSQFLELRTFAISEIARVFRINPILLGEMGRATFSNSTEMGRQFICFTLQPWVKRWEAEIALKLFDPAQKGKFRAEIDTDQFDRIDLNTRAAGYAAMIAARVMNPNECRAQEGLPPYAGGEAFFNPNTASTTVQENVSV